MSVLAFKCIAHSRRRDVYRISKIENVLQTILFKILPSCIRKKVLKSKYKFFSINSPLEDFHLFSLNCAFLVLEKLL